ncbi:hypothetical protein CBW65_17570 [Tumebacillus avium]|uniref:Uncharacterized protein n=1 Tax=Tumebacillus avium TaxID=1903704 RepID=A0A1Y0IPQ0_9BACL|nr:hypothetical protein CBW65_17570 [Tumebacillus avium]
MRKFLLFGPDTKNYLHLIGPIRVTIHLVTAYFLQLEQPLRLRIGQDRGVFFMPKTEKLWREWKEMTVCPLQK